MLRRDPSMLRRLRVAPMKQHLRSDARDTAHAIVGCFLFGLALSSGLDDMDQPRSQGKTETARTAKAECAAAGARLTRQVIFVCCRDRP